MNKKSMTKVLSDKLILHVLAQFTFVCNSILMAQGWEWQNPLPTGFNYYDVVMFDKNEILISTNSPKLIRSTDGGTTWNIERTEKGELVFDKMQYDNGLLYCFVNNGNAKNILLSMIVAKRSKKSQALFMTRPI